MYVMTDVVVVVEVCAPIETHLHRNIYRYHFFAIYTRKIYLVPSGLPFRAFAFLPSRPQNSNRQDIDWQQAAAEVELATSNGGVDLGNGERNLYCSSRSKFLFSQHVM
jgi:hypothetical protein